ncbi:hypothetical protein [Nocardioides marmoribigeumensis]|uniref:Membrane protein YhdT n=1 Tax=Nocardioides marmoribigeumensis TaxID=433649 RepID=A0ABU2BVY7_9ACTN|nr:hypothetical protein [Nocardioides marmoribigeumensis]MDR7362810.1 putative membrane protein YhdT [Nocardioides marmoribigeumensis]
MTEVGVWLLVVGLVDLVRAARDVTRSGRRLLMAVLGVLLLAGAVLAYAPSVRVGLLDLAVWSAAFLSWLLGSAVALSTRSARARVVAFAGWAVGLAWSLLAGGRLAAALPAQVEGPLSSVSPDRLVLVLGVLVAQLSTVNLLVRLVLDAVGVPAATNEKSLKGGRLLGPMERLLIVGLGLAGHVTAASIVVAAKGLLRFPELQRGAATSGPSDVTEYFLIGSFASWLLALGGVALCAW